jgi:hypothetical protein
MNVMKEAHKITRATIEASPVKLEYRSLFRAALCDFHKKAKAMNESAKLKAHFLAQFEQRIVELHEANAQYGNKWIVVCGDDHPMPINFESTTDNFWSNVEGASKWSSRQFAQANATKVVNGNQNVGSAVLVSDHVAWDIANLQKLIADLKAE